MGVTDYTSVLLYYRLWFYNQPSPDTLYHTKAENAIYGATLLLGAGATTLLVTSLSMVADLIGCTVVCMCVCVCVRRCEYMYE